jgi:hypothetical protein
MAWTALTFGKHADKTLPQVVIADPDWFYNAIKKNFSKATVRFSMKQKRYAINQKESEFLKIMGEKW